MIPFPKSIDSKETLKLVIDKNKKLKQKPILDNEIGYYYDPSTETWMIYEECVNVNSSLFTPKEYVKKEVQPDDDDTRAKLLEYISYAEMIIHGGNANTVLNIIYLGFIYIMFLFYGPNFLSLQNFILFIFTIIGTCYEIYKNNSNNSWYKIYAKMIYERLPESCTSVDETRV